MNSGEAGNVKIWFIANIVFWGLGGLWVQQTGFHSWCSVMTVLTRWQVCEMLQTWHLTYILYLRQPFFYPSGTPKELA